jgi:hypothetical protein
MTQHGPIGNHFCRKAAMRRRQGGLAALSALAMTRSKLLIALAERGPILGTRQEAAIRGAN